jgi:hypothetical protein
MGLMPLAPVIFLLCNDWTLYLLFSRGGGILEILGDSGVPISFD